MRRTVAPIICGLALVLAGCSSPLADEIATYDPAEVQMLRDQAAAANFESDDESMLAILEYRQSCRDIRSGLDDLAAGASPDTVADTLEAQIVEPFRETQPESTEHNQMLVDALRLGDPAAMLRNHTLNCADVT